MKKTKRNLFLFITVFSVVIFCSCGFAINEYLNGSGLTTPAPDKKISVGINNNSYWNGFPVPDQRIAFGINNDSFWSGIPVPDKRIAIGINNNSFWSGIPVPSKRIAISINDRQTWNSSLPVPDQRIAIAVNNKELWNGGLGIANPDIRIALSVNDNIDADKLKLAIAMALSDALSDIQTKSNKANKSNFLDLNF